MKRKIRSNFLRAGLLFAGVTVFLFFGLLKAFVPGIPAKSMIRLIGSAAVIFLLLAVVVALLMTNCVVRQSLRPLRMMVQYLNSLLSGNIMETMPSTEEEEALASLLDTSEEQQAFLQQLANVRENERMRQQFSANVSHELKSPLTSINGYAEMIESGMVGFEDTRRFAGIIYREGVRLLNMINEIIQLSKFDTGYSDFDQRTALNLHEIARQEMETLGSMADERHVRLLLDVQGEGADNEVPLFGNQRLITDVVRNLLSNAIKYSKPTGGNVAIRLRAGQEKVEMMVEDDGIGIAPENQERVFERFFVVDPGRTRSEGSGTGLGLSLVKHTVEAYGGTLQLKSAIGQGSQFLITLPRQSRSQMPLKKSEPSNAIR